jgi:oxygen-independent coproporphyrinogen III oxidase
MRTNLPEFMQELESIGVALAPEKYGFIRYYPPLEELPKRSGVSPEDLHVPPIDGGLAAFVYIPFCTGGCSYCFYPKTVNPPPSRVNQFISDVRAEAELFGSRVEGSRVKSVYIGGGTPTYLSEAQIVRVFDLLRANLNLDSLESCTCECSPETLDAGKLAVLKECGVTRVSVGIQSLDDAILSAHRRRYTSSDAVETASLLQGSGLPFNLDFIYGLDGQSLDDVAACLTLVKECCPPSVTFYQRWFSMRDRFTPIASSGGVENISDIVAMRDLITDSLADLGYSPDSLFRFVKDSSSGCAYCKLVWEDNSCIALGPSAYSYMQGLAFRNMKTFPRYSSALQQGLFPIERLKELSVRERANRALILGLKTAGMGACGVNLTSIEKKYNVQFSPKLISLLSRFVSAGALQEVNGGISFTKDGALFAEGILGRVMEEVGFGF